MKKLTRLATGIALTSAAMAISTTASAELSANASATNNYIWRGLTQSVNETAIQGGLDYSNESGFYLGTWASNVSYAADDVFSYEHDMYGGFSGETDLLSYDIGYLYYNYDEAAEFDFSEVYGSVGIGGFTLGAYILADTEASEGPGQDFGFAEATYLYADYAMEVGNGMELGFHIGRHAGDFNEAFNGVPGDYTDYNISIAKGGFSFMITDTDLDDVGPDALDNDEMKFVIGFAMDFEL